MQCDYDINSPPEAVPDALKWSFDDEGRLKSLTTNFVIDIPNSNVQAGTILQTWPNNGGGENQMWIISDIPYVQGFVLRCKENPQLVLESYKVQRDSVLVWVKRYTGSIWQHWILTPEGYLASSATDNGKMMVLTLVDDIVDGKLYSIELRLTPAANTYTQKWKMDDKGRILLQSNQEFAATRDHVTVYDMQDHTTRFIKDHCLILSDDKSVGQQFLMGYSSPSYYFLQNMALGQVLGIENTDAAVGAQVNLYVKNKASFMPFEQLWKFRDGYLISAVSDSKVRRGESLVLDATNGAPMQLQRFNNSDGQLWNFQFDFTGVSMTNLKNNKVFGSLSFDDDERALKQKWWIIPVSDFKGAMVLIIEFDKG